NRLITERNWKIFWSKTGDNNSKPYFFAIHNVACIWNCHLIIPPKQETTSSHNYLVIIHTLGMYDKIHPAVSQATSFSSGFYDIHFINHFSSDMCLVRVDGKVTPLLLLNSQHNIRTEPMKTEASTHLPGGHLSDETGFHSDLTDIFDSEIIAP
ncbi:unnamed protein product, partial [Callosobruchus maculatus]